MARAERWASAPEDGAVGGVRPGLVGGGRGRGGWRQALAVTGVGEVGGGRHWR
ncbi:hypothetical protein Ade02nite_11050 [Paractinoplanes deccanensis]|uniref:Uncharacterized protein n=1 Tax=Paractinoplanes deccanensis TaxID=113561 RepID=A0ABQ3XXM2_9ACTN|nr:hypothetical protein Ade02nite_11050 [Actinoplanes deccanensis]